VSYCDNFKEDRWEEMETAERTSVNLRFSGRPGTMQLKEFFTRHAAYIRKQKQRRADFNEWDAFELLPECLEDVALQEWENFYQAHDADIQEVEQFYNTQRRLLEFFKETSYDKLPSIPKGMLGKPATKGSSGKSQPATTSGTSGDNDELEEEERGETKAKLLAAAKKAASAQASRWEEQLDEDEPLTKQEQAVRAVANLMQATPPGFQPLLEFRLHLEHVFGGLRADLLEKLANFKREPGDTLLMMKNRLIELSNRVGNYDDIQKGRIFLAAQAQDVQDALRTPLLLQYRGKAALDEVYDMVN
jgi:hypothetical protein